MVQIVLLVIPISLKNVLVVLEGSNSWITMNVDVNLTNIFSNLLVKDARQNAKHALDLKGSASPVEKVRP